MRTVTLRVVIPEDRKLEIQLPRDVDAGPAEVAVVVESRVQSKPVGEDYGWTRFCLENPLDLGSDDLSERVEDFTGRRF